MSWTKPFSEISKGDAATAGGKGASLGEMTQAGIPVPPGFVVLASAFDRFLQATDLNIEIDAALKTVDPENMETVERVSERLQALILSKQIPEDINSIILQNYRTLGAEFVAVRSSATAEDSASAAWAGQLDTYLNTTRYRLSCRYCFPRTRQALHHRYKDCDKNFQRRRHGGSGCGEGGGAESVISGCNETALSVVVFEQLWRRIRLYR